jgi:hypothetical protein
MGEAGGSRKVEVRSREAKSGGGSRGRKSGGGSRKAEVGRREAEDGRRESFAINTLPLYIE